MISANKTKFREVASMLSALQRRRVAWLLDGHLADDYDEATFPARWQEHFAATSSPEEFFLYTAGSHPNQSPEEWRRLLDHPLCDMGTALLIFWRNSPIHFYGVEPTGGWDQERYDLVREIERRYSAGTFSSSVVRFDPASFKGHSFLGSHQPEERERVPEIMRRPSPGEPVPPLGKADFEWGDEF